MSEPILKNDVFQQGGVVFALSSHVHIIDRLQELEPKDLRTLLSENNLPAHENMPRKEVEFVLGAVLQQQWFFQKTGEVPARIAQTAKSYSERYGEMVDKLDRGESVMPEKKAKKAKEKKEKKERVVSAFEINPEKARAFEDGKYVKKGEGGKLDGSHAGFIVRAMLANKKPFTNEELVEQIKKDGYKFSGKGQLINTALAKLLSAKIISKSKPDAK